MSSEHDKIRELCKRVTTLEADLTHGTEQALFNEAEVDCLQIELADADVDAQNARQDVAVGIQSPVVCKHVEDMGLSIQLSCLLRLPWTAALM